MLKEEWAGFKAGRWCNTSVNVRDFIQHNYTPYDGNEEFLSGPTAATKKLSRLGNCRLTHNFIKIFIYFSLQ